MKSRVYRDRIEINSDNTRTFYDQRAKSIKNRQQEYTTVLLGDQDPDYAVKWNEYEKGFILPKLNITEQSRVLDLGCGMGRWADALDGKCHYYCGVDFSSEMIKLAEGRNRNGEFWFSQMSVADALADHEVIGEHYDIIIMTGVSMYINDRELAECYLGFQNVASVNPLVYLEESVGKEQRLTLNHIWSDNLGDYYGAIYRTREEYLELLRSNIRSLDIVEEGYMDVLDKEEQSETSHWYALFHI